VTNGTAWVRLSADQRYHLWAQALDIAGAVARSVPWVALFGFIAYCLQTVLVAYAGVDTRADVVIRLLGEFRLNVMLPYLAAAGGVGYGLVERGLRRRTIKRLTARTQELELQIDSGRTSSGLTPRGTTHPRDR